MDITILWTIKLCHKVNYRRPRSARFTVSLSKRTTSSTTLLTKSYWISASSSSAPITKRVTESDSKTQYKHMWACLRNKIKKVTSNWPNLSTDKRFTRATCLKLSQCKVCVKMNSTMHRLIWQVHKVLPNNHIIWKSTVIRFKNRTI